MPSLRTATAWFGRSIGARIVVLSLGLLFAIQVASFSAVRASLGAHARNMLSDQLGVGERVLGSLLVQNAQSLAERTRRVAADEDLHASLRSGNTPTLTSVLQSRTASAGATQAALLSPEFVLRTGNGRDTGGLRQIAARLAAVAMRDGVASEIAVLDGRALQVVLVPVKVPAPAGWLLMGFPLDHHLADEMRALSGLDVTLLTRAAEGAPWTVALTSTPTDRAADFAREPWSVSATAGAAPRAVTFDEETFGVRAKWLTPVVVSHGASHQPPAVLALVSLSIDAAVRPPRDLQLALASITLLGFVVFLFGSLLAARWLTTPLRALSAAADRLRAGDYTTPMRGLRRVDEIGHLAHAFEQMRVSVAEKQDQILKLAYWDSLTGLPNRMQFRDAVSDAIAQARAAAAAHREDGATPSPSVAVITLDLDRFKHVNDVLGYRVGDLLLGRVGERLTQQIVRGGDLLARLGDDEFAVLLRHGSAAQAESVARRLSAAFDTPLTLEEHTVDMGAGIGMACWPQHAGDADTLLGHAEIAMYAAKRRSQGPLMYDASVDAASLQTLSLLTELRQALERDELRLYLQPKLTLSTGRVGGAEALVRWQHPLRGLVAPDEFIPFAEQTGFVRVLTMWVFEEAARHWLALQGEGVTLTLSVNLSTRDLLDPELAHKFDALLVKHRVPAEAFCLEITESAIMDDPHRALATLSRLSELGFRLSIDDFGTGYSSLAYLKRLPVDELKIDKSFVMGMAHDPDDAKIVRSTIDLAHNLGLSVVAEGVETERVWALLRELDCDEAQGYHMGRPMPANEFRAWTLAWSARQRPRSTAAPGPVFH